MKILDDKLVFFFSASLLFMLPLAAANAEPLLQPKAPHASANLSGSIKTPAPVDPIKPSQANLPAWLELSKKSGLVDVSTVIPSLVVDLRYASKNNFTGKVLYPELKICVLQRDAAQQLAKANALLQQRAPGLRLIAYDCLRPRRYQWTMWNVVVGTKQQSYVADPNKAGGSMHNYGCAIDLSLADATGQALDMGTPFDFFGHKAQPRHEMRFYRSGELSAEQLANRLLLREVMLRSGFVAISNEWWHFNAFWPKQVRQRYRIVE